MNVEDLFSAVTSVLPKTEVEGVLATLKSEDGEWTDDAPTKLKEALAGHIKTIGENNLNRGIKAGAKPYEKQLRSLAEGMEVDLTTTDDPITTLFDHVRKSATPAKSDALPTDPEELLKRPEIRTILSERVETATKTLAQQIEALKAEYANKQKNWELGKVRSRIESMIAQTVQKKKVPLGDQPDKRMRVFLNDPLFSPQRWTENDKGEFISLGDDGEPRYDEVTGQAITFERVFEEINPFGYDVHDSTKQSPPADGKNGKTVSRYSFNGDFSKYQQARNAAKGDPSKMKEISDAWLAEKKGS